MKTYLPFDYVVTLACAANGQAVVNLQLNQDADFELHNVFGLSSRDAATDQHPNNFTMQWVDASTGRQFTQGAVPQAAFGGPSNFSVREFRPITFSRNTQLQFTATDTSGNTNTVTVVLKGYKVYGA
jgi:hypothetical protein